MSYLLYAEFIFDSSSSSFAAFKNIGRGAGIFTGKGLLEAKLMGAGAGNGFSVWPDFKRYALLFLFRTEEDAIHFQKSNDQLQWYLEHSKQHLLALLEPFKGHGSWAGKQPFSYSGDSLEGHEPLAVITRATIRARALVDFWRNVPKVAAFMSSTAAVHQVGIGEYPIFMQATFSIWESLEKLKTAAYQNTPHAEVVKKTRERNWYKEELFAEFRIRAVSFKGEKFQKLSRLNLTTLQNPS